MICLTNTEVYFTNDTYYSLLHVTYKIGNKQEIEMHDFLGKYLYESLAIEYCIDCDQCEICGKQITHLVSFLPGISTHIATHLQ